MAETEQQRKERLIKEREQRIQQRRRQIEGDKSGHVDYVAKLRIKYVIYKQQFDVKYYQITQNFKNAFNKYTSKDFWQKEKVKIVWALKETKNNLLQAKDELLSFPTQIKNWRNRLKQETQLSLTAAIGSPLIPVLEKENQYLKQMMFHYQQTLLNAQWLGNKLRDNILNHVEMFKVAEITIKNAEIAPTERDRSLYDLLIAVSKERQLRKQREFTKYEYGSTEFWISEKTMRKAESDVDAKLEEWDHFLKEFTRPWT